MADAQPSRPNGSARPDPDAEGQALIEHGLAAHRAGDLARAGAIYTQVLQLKPHDAAKRGNAFHLLALIAHTQGDNEHALELLECALDEAPNEANFYHTCGVVLRAQGRDDDAVGYYARALEIDPERALSHTALGNVLKAKGRFENAEAHQRRAIEIEPGFAEGWSNLGLTYKDWGRGDQAIRCFQKAVALAGDHPELHYNLGNALLATDEVGGAVASLKSALALNPGHVRARANLGIALKEDGHLTEAVASLRDALLLDPGSADIHWNLGLALLLGGEFEEGWREYEWRRMIPEIGVRQFDRPSWDGSLFKGKTLLVHAEQGLGDSLQFIRYAALAKERGGVVKFESPKPLARILAGCSSIDRIIPRGEPIGDFDIHIPLLSLPMIFATGPATVPAEIPYLSPDPDLVAHWGERLERDGNFRIGICWQGNPSYKADARRSVPLEHFAPLGTVEGVSLYSLQKEFGTKQLAAFGAEHGIIDLGPELDEDHGAFMDSLAVIKHLDLVITSDTAMPHLAGAVGCEVWMALAHVPDWRWGMAGETTPWYPTMRFYRQHRAGDWGGVFDAIKCALEDRLRNRHGG